MDFGMPFLIETPTRENCIALCRQLGLAFVEWNMNFPQCQPESFDAAILSQIRDREGIYFTFHLDENLGICDFNPKVRAAYLETVLETIRIAVKTKSPIVNMHLPKGISITLPQRRRFLFEEYQDLYQKFLLEFRNLCEDAVGASDVHIAIENTVGFASYELEAVELLLKSECFGLTLDIGHSYSAGEKDFPFYQKHMDRLIHMHAHDALGGKNHLAFGDGEINLAQKLDIAEETGARVVLETKTIAALQKTVAFIRENQL